MLAETKLCPDCGTERPVHEFGRNRPARDGLSTYCRTHNNRRHNEWVARRGGHRGVVRGILCALCNVGLGHFGDDPQRLESAARYLKGSN